MHAARELDQWRAQLSFYRRHGRLWLSLPPLPHESAGVLVWYLRPCDPMCSYSLVCSYGTSRVLVRYLRCARTVSPVCFVRYLPCACAVSPVCSYSISHVLVWYLPCALYSISRMTLQDQRARCMCLLFLQVKKQARTTLQLCVQGIRILHHLATGTCAVLRFAAQSATQHLWHHVALQAGL